MVRKAARQSGYTRIDARIGPRRHRLPPFSIFRGDMFSCLPTSAVRLRTPFPADAYIPSRPVASFA